MAVPQFSQVGPPRNVTVQPKPDGDAYVVSWDAPDYGLDTLRVYVVRWYREPGHYFHGSAETRELYYEGGSIMASIDEHQQQCALTYPCSQYFTVHPLLEDQLYTFQVFSLSNTDYQVGSNEFELLVPPYRRMRAIAIGATVTLLVLLGASAVYIYTKKRCFRPYGSSEAGGMEKS